MLNFRHRPVAAWGTILFVCISSLVITSCNNSKDTGTPADTGEIQVSTSAPVPIEVSNIFDSARAFSIAFSVARFDNSPITSITINRTFDEPEGGWGGYMNQFISHYSTSPSNGVKNITGDPAVYRDTVRITPTNPFGWPFTVPGEHTVVITARNQAGNTRTKRVTVVSSRSGIAPPRTNVTFPRNHSIYFSDTASTNRVVLKWKATKITQNNMTSCTININGLPFDGYSALVGPGTKPIGGNPTVWEDSLVMVRGTASWPFKRSRDYLIEIRVNNTAGSSSSTGRTFYWQ